MNKKFFIALIIIFLAVLTFEIQLSAKERAKDFTLKTKEGVNITLSKTKNRVILLNFFAKWCKPCKEEVPYLNKLSEKYREYLQIFAIPYQENDKDKIEEIVSEFSIKYIVLIDNKGLVAKGYKVYSLPYSVLISSDKYIMGTYRGISEIVKKDLEKNIEKEIKKIKEQKGKITLKIGRFENLTKKAKEEKLGEKVRNKIIEYLKNKDNIIIKEDAKYKVTGFVSKFTDTFGVEVILTEVSTDKTLGKFSCGIEKDDYSPLYTRLQYLLQGPEPGCCSWKEK